jgi:hypothetical protein
MKRVQTDEGNTCTERGMSVPLFDGIMNKPQVRRISFAQYRLQLVGITALVNIRPALRVNCSD